MQFDGDSTPNLREIGRWNSGHDTEAPRWWRSDRWPAPWRCRRCVQALDVGRGIFCRKIEDGCKSMALALEIAIIYRSDRGVRRFVTSGPLRVYGIRSNRISRTCLDCKRMFVILWAKCAWRFCWISGIYRTIFRQCHIHMLTQVFEKSFLDRQPPGPRLPVYCAPCLTRTLLHLVAKASIEKDVYMIDTFLPATCCQKEVFTLLAGVALVWISPPVSLIDSQMEWNAHSCVRYDISRPSMCSVSRSPRNVLFEFFRER